MCAANKTRRPLTPVRPRGKGSVFGHGASVPVELTGTIGLTGKKCGQPEDQRVSMGTRRGQEGASCGDQRGAEKEPTRGAF